MTSSIGNKFLPFGQKGFTFLEIMITIVVLSTGIVAIYKTFLLCLDHQRYLTHRLYASNLIDRRTAQLQALFREKGDAFQNQSKVPLDENGFLFNQEVPFEIKTFVR